LVYRSVEAVIRGFSSLNPSGLSASSALLLSRLADPASLPDFVAILALASAVAIVSKKHVKLKTYCVPAYLAACTWLLIRFVRTNLPIWFTISKPAGHLLGYVLSVAINVSMAAMCGYWLIFVAAFCRRDRWLTGWRHRLAYLPLAWAIIFVPTNPLHHLFYPTLELNTRTYGPCYWIFLLLVLGLPLVAQTWFVHLAWESREPIYRKQALIMALANLLPIVGGFAEALQLLPVSMRRVGGLGLAEGANGILTCYALLMMGFLDVLPIAMREVFLAMSDAVLVLDNESRVVQVNPAARKVFRRLDPGTQIEAASPELTGKIGSCIAAGREEFEADIGGVVYWGRLLQFRSTADVAGLLVILTDITPRKRMEDALRLSEERFRSLVQNAMDIISVFDADGTILYESPSVLRILGWDPDELLGKSILDFADPAEIHDIASRIVDTAKDPKHSIAIELNIRHKDGSWRRLESIGRNLIDNPSVAGLVFNSRDITERKRVEQKISQFARDLERSNKQLESFAYIASHDLQEPLRKLQTLGDRLAMKYGDVLGEEGGDYLLRMHKSATRMQMLIKDLLAFSRVSNREPAFGAVDMAEVAAEVLSDLEPQIEQSQASVEVKGLGTIVADPTQMRQLLQNLISNALKFRTEGRPPIIKVTGQCIDGRAEGPLEGHRQSLFQLTVEDNGVGFDEKYSERIFSPFQRLHGRDEYEGTGIGLAICRSIVERHRGSIDVNSSPGVGTTFIVKMRARPAEFSDVSPGQTAPPASNSSSASVNGGAAEQLS
jgi:two-component system sensor kinase FixL